MATLQVWTNGAWATYSTASPAPPGKVQYFRSIGHSAAAADGTAAFPTAGAKRIVAYLGNIASGTLTAGDLEIAAVCFTGGDAPTHATCRFEQLHGATHSNGVLTTVATGVRAAYSEVCAAQSSVQYVSPAGTTTDFDIIIEVHYE